MGYTTHTLSVTVNPEPTSTTCVVMAGPDLTGADEINAFVCDTCAGLEILASESVVAWIRLYHVEWVLKRSVSRDR